MAKETYYFSHDSNAITDTKILNMRADYGMEGYGLYWAIIEMMRNEEDYKLFYNKNTYRAIKTLTATNIDVEKYIQDCINEYELFVQDKEKFYSKSLLCRMQEYERKRQVNRENGKLGGRPKKQNQDKTDEKPKGFENETEKNQNKIKESKIKENKVKENIVVVNEQSDSCVDEIVDFYNNNIGAATQYSFQVLKDYEREMGTELVIYAMQKAVDNNVRNIRYIKAILNNWNNKGIKTLIEAQQEWKDKEDNNSVDWGKLYDNLIPKEGEKNAD